MKTSIKYALTILLCSSLVAILFACGGNGEGTSSKANSLDSFVDTGSSNLNSANPRNPLIGTWVSREYRLTFNPDSTYVRDFNQEGIPALQGSVTMSGNVLIVTDTGSCGDSAAEEGTRGSYTYAISGNRLTFCLFHDPCRDRAALFERTYIKQ